jgi:hypothetical protein
MSPPRLRLVVDGRSPHLAVTVGALAGIGVVVIGLSAAAGPGEESGDTVGLVVEPSFPIDLPAIEHVLREVGCGLDSLAPVAPAPVVLSSERVA